MGRMHDALRKAAEERESKRRRHTDPSVRRPTTTGANAPEQTAIDGAGADVVRPTTTRRPLETRTNEFLRDRETRRPPTTQGFARETARHVTVAETSLTEVPKGLATPVQPLGEAARARIRLGVIDERLIVFHNPRDARTEQFRSLRANLLTLEQIPKTILLTSGSPNEGKSLTAVNLAAALVEDGIHTVCLIDANLRVPGLHTLLGTEDGPGLVEVLTGVEPEPMSVIQETGIPGVSVLAAGDIPDNPGALLVRRSLRRVLDAVAANFDYVLIDTPAMNPFADASVLAPETDGVLMVVQLESSPKARTERAVETLQAARARILGSVVTNAR